MTRKKTTAVRKKRAVKEPEILLETITLEEVINILTFYGIEHCRFVSNYIADDLDIPTLHGLTIDNRKLILIDKEQCIEKTREAVICELIRVKHHFKGDLPKKSKIVNDTVEAETKLTYKEIYGVEP
ncbi:hypothetical protein L6261_03110 [Candidatus Parcubacteria bacterium]|nr:hypothetical protein [Candidatus Parcubacteria bacterium]